MKIIVTQDQTFGPFNSVETLEDRYRADGVDFQFSVIGDATVRDQGDWTPPVPPPPVPESVSPRQIRQALTRINLRSMVESAIGASDVDTRDWYEFATEFRRDHPMVSALAQGLNVTDEQLDDLWRLAATL